MLGTLSGGICRRRMLPDAAAASRPGRSARPQIRPDQRRTSGFDRDAIPDPDATLARHRRHIQALAVTPAFVVHTGESPICSGTRS